MNAREFTELLTPLVNVLQKHYFQVEEEKLTQQELRAIYFLGSMPKSTLNHLAEYLHVKKSSASVMVDKLTAMRVINRSVPLENRRIVELTLASEGEKIFQEMQKRHEDALGHVLLMLSENEQKILASILHKIIKTIN